MSCSKMVYFVQKLYRKTDAGSVQWEEDEVEGIYQVVFPEYTVRIWLQFQDGYGPGSEDYVLGIFNARGLKIEEVSDVDLAEDLSDSYEALKHLYQAARRKEMGVDKALDSLLSSLGDDGLSS